MSIGIFCGCLGEWRFLYSVQTKTINRNWYANSLLYSGLRLFVQESKSKEKQKPHLHTSIETYKLTKHTHTRMTTNRCSEGFQLFHIGRVLSCSLSQCQLDRTTLYTLQFVLNFTSGWQHEGPARFIVGPAQMHF